METVLLRQLIFEHLIHNYQTQLVEIFQNVRNIAVERGLIQSPTDLTGNDDERMREITWSLVFEGVLVPGHSAQSPNFPLVRLTPYGRDSLTAAAPLPHDPDGYLQRLRTALPTFDSVAEVYLTEALQTFLRGNYFASAVMAGVASERLMLLMIDSVKNALSTPTKQTKFEQDTKGRPIKRQYDEFRKRVDPILNTLPQNLRDLLPTYLDGIYNFIRTYRNDAGHPTGRRVEREEAFAILQLFPSYCKVAYDLMGWLIHNQI